MHAAAISRVTFGAAFIVALLGRKNMDSTNVMKLPIVVTVLMTLVDWYYIRSYKFYFFLYNDISHCNLLTPSKGGLNVYREHTGFREADFFFLRFIIGLLTPAGQAAFEHWAHGNSPRQAQQKPLPPPPKETATRRG